MSRAAFEGLAHQLVNAMLARALQILAVLQHGPECGVDHRFVKLAATQLGECLRPVDRLSDTRRLVQVQLAYSFDRGSNWRASRSSACGTRSLTMRTSRSKSGCSIQ